MIRPADDLGPVLSGRFEAEELRRRIEHEAEAGDVVVNFSGVEAMSPSFADEFFAKLARDLIASGRVKFKGLDPDLQALARFVKEGREAAG